MMKKLIPGETVHLQDIGLDVTVYPAGFTHLRKFGTELGALMQMMGPKTKISKDEFKIGMDLMAELIPFVMTNCLDLVRECVVFPEGVAGWDDLAHWHVPPIVEAWIEVNFGDEGKVKPWLTMVERVVSMISGQKMSISEIFSKSSLRQGTTSTPSTTASDPAGPIEGGA